MFGVTFDHLPVRVFGHDDRTVDKHAQAKQQTEHDHEVERHAHHPDDGYRKQERRWNAHAHDETAADAHRRDDEDHHENECRDDVALQLRDLTLGVTRKITCEEQIYIGGQPINVALRYSFHCI